MPTHHYHFHTSSSCLYIITMPTHYYHACTLLSYKHIIIIHTHYYHTYTSLSRIQVIIMPAHYHHAYTLLPCQPINIICTHYHTYILILCTCLYITFHVYAYLSVFSNMYSYRYIHYGVKLINQMAITHDKENNQT